MYWPQNRETVSYSVIQSILICISHDVSVQPTLGITSPRAHYAAYIPSAILSPEVTILGGQ